MLVPFLIMAVSVSHGVQYVNSWAHEISTRNATSYQASLATFRNLAIPGVVALLTNVVGFSTIYLINIDVIREMSINAAFGMAGDRKSTRLNSRHSCAYRMPSSAVKKKKKYN